MAGAKQKRHIFSWINEDGKKTTISRSYRQLQKDFPHLVTSLTKAGTQVAANKWIKQRRAERELSPVITWQAPFIQALGLMKMKLAHFEEIHDEQGVKEIRTKIEATEYLLSSQYEQKHIVGLILNDEMQQVEWNNRLNPTDEPIQLVEDIAKQYIENQANRVGKTGKSGLSKAKYKEKERHINHVIDNSRGVAIDKVDASYVRKIFTSISEKKCSDTTKHDYMGTFRLFINHLYNEEKIERLPRNLKHRDLTFTPEEIEVKAPKAQDVAYLLKKLRENNEPLLELVALLSLNCGMYTKDIEHLTADQIDLNNGTLSYARHKNKKYKIKPTKYLLWNETKELLLKVGDFEGKHFLTSKKGSTLLSDDDERKDLIGNTFTRFKKKHAPLYEFDLMDLRKTGSTLLKRMKHDEAKKMYLQRRPANIDEKHYEEKFQSDLDQGLMALGKHLKLHK